MRISERLRSRAPFFSFEFFPPKTDAGVASLMDALATLRALDPAYVSVTYGSGGSTRDRTIEIAKRIKHEVGLDVLAHVTCSGSTADDLRALLRDLEAAGIENVLALRGDPPKGSEAFAPVDGGFRYASDLVAMLEREFDFCIAGA
jgi:methylenetetrahydrofolate reductase (NADPH)